MDFIEIQYIGFSRWEAAKIERNFEFTLDEINLNSGGSRIFPRGVRQLPKVLLFFNFLAENCMKMKEFGPPGGGASLAPPPWIRQCLNKWRQSILVSSTSSYAVAEIHPDSRREAASGWTRARDRADGTGRSLPVRDEQNQPLRAETKGSLLQEEVQWEDEWM